MDDNDFSNNDVWCCRSGRFRVRFNDAVGYISSLTDQESREPVAKAKGKVTQENQLNLYAWYKQAKDGDAQDSNAPSLKKDGKNYFKKLAMFNAWKGCKGKTKDFAMKEYIALKNSIEALIEANKS